MSSVSCFNSFQTEKAGAAEVLELSTGMEGLAGRVKAGEQE